MASVVKTIEAMTAKKLENKRPVISWGNHEYGIDEFRSLVMSKKYN
jgi:hypothetical protein